MWERYPLAELLLAEKRIKAAIASLPVNSFAWCQSRGQLAKVEYYIFDNIQHSHSISATAYLYSSMKAGFSLACDRFDNGPEDEEWLPESVVINLEGMSISELFTLGVASYAGINRPVDKKLMFRCFERILFLDPNNTETQNNMGILFLYGRGVKSSIPEATKYYRLAAEQGHATAQYNLGDIYLRGKGIPQDKEEGLKWLRSAAMQGHAAAQKELAEILIKGEQSNEENKKEGLVWCYLAAEQEYQSAQFDLACCYLCCEESKVEEALQWFKRCAMLGSKDAAWTLGKRYRLGKHMPTPNKEEAAKWFRVAVKYGKKKASAALLELMSDTPSFEIRYHHCLCDFPRKTEVVELIQANRESFLQLLKDDEIIDQKHLFCVIQYISEISSPEEWGSLLIDYLPYLTFSQMATLFKTQIDLSECRFNGERSVEDPAMDIGLVIFDLLNKYKMVIQDELMVSYEREAFHKMIYFTFSLFLNIARENQNSLRGDFSCIYAKLVLISFCEVSADYVVNNLDDLERVMAMPEVAERLGHYASCEELSYKKLKR